MNGNTSDDLLARQWLGLEDWLPRTPDQSTRRLNLRTSDDILATGLMPELRELLTGAGARPGTKTGTVGSQQFLGPAQG